MKWVHLVRRETKAPQATLVLLEQLVRLDQVATWDLVDLQVPLEAWGQQVLLVNVGPRETTVNLVHLVVMAAQEMTATMESLV